MAITKEEARAELEEAFHGEHTYVGETTDAFIFAWEPPQMADLPNGAWQHKITKDGLVYWKSPEADEWFYDYKI